MKRFTFMLWASLFFFAPNIFSKENIIVYDMPSVESEELPYREFLDDTYFKALTSQELLQIEKHDKENKTSKNNIEDTFPSKTTQFPTLLNSNNNNEGCDTPNLVIDTPDWICQGESTTITASTDGNDINWYADETAETLIHTGLTFTTPDLEETTSYWAQAVTYTGEGEEITGGGRIAPTSNSGSTVNPVSTPWGLSFDTTEDFTINSVDVYLTSSTPGSLVMQLLDENWELIEETTVDCPAGNSSNPLQFEVPLDFQVEGNNTYRLVASSSPNMIREFGSSHEGFPYPIGDVGQVTGGTINNANTNENVYYFFYNWTVSTEPTESCESTLEEVIVTVNPIPDAPIAEEEQLLNPGDTLGDLEVEATGELTWYEDEAGTIILPEDTELVDGSTYYVSQTIDGCESLLLAITVNLQMGIGEHQNIVVAIYPNPVTDFLFINTEESIDFIQVYDLAGRKLASLDNWTDNRIDFSEYAVGTYIIQVTSGERNQTIKVIKK